jgi:two-component system, OmpR family, alkaline phosphatase synthesis response regulator PhoP
MPKRILLIDDDQDFVSMNRMALEKAGYQVLTAYDGKEGLEKAIREKPDCIVLDVMMTEETEGFHTAKAIREHETLSRTPILMLTSIREAMDLPFKYEPDEQFLPVTEFVEKPLPPAELVAKVGKLTEKK